jgi:hypothetical protein
VEVCATVVDFERARRERGLTPTEAAREAGVPRSTLRDWIARTRGGSLTPGQRAFFETPDGLALLRTLLVAAIFVMNLCGGLGVAMVRAFFRHAGLDELIACSETSLRRSRSAMITAISAWGDAQDRELAQTMPTRDILACVDENFHAAMMLVAMEPVSGMLLVERYATHRDGATWAEALREVKAVWPVRLLALVGDEARGLIRCAQKHLGVLKASDLFHVQYEISRGVAGTVGRSVREAERDLETARAACEAVCADRQAWAQTRHGPGRPPDFDKREALAAQAVKDAVIALETAQKHRAELRAAVRDLGDRYHPIDLATGALQTTETVEERLLEGFERVWDCVVSAGLGDHSARVCNAIAKAQRVVPSLVSMVAWWHRTVSARLAALSLTTQERAWVVGSLLPVMYLDREAARGADKDARARLRAQRDRLHATLDAAGSPWVSWSRERRAEVRSVVQGCVDLFVRASSCVEGRNGQLSLHHHRTHRLPNDLLRALTVIHNYALTRRDGTTAAERFSGSKHNDLFKHLLTLAPMPARPRVRRRSERPDLIAA